MSDRAKLLTEIAEALAVPVKVFMNVDDRPDECLASVEECTELLEAFRHIGDYQARRRCLSYVKAAAERSTGGA